MMFSRLRLVFGIVKLILSRLGLVLASIIVTIFLLEGVLRIFLPQQLVLIRPDVWIPDDVVSWRKASNIDTSINTGERKVRLLTDNYGHRIGMKNRGEKAYRILALGDSFLVALQVEYEQTMTALLEEMLSEELGDTVHVVNTGVGGWNPNHYLAKARQELIRTTYDLVLVFIYLPNDIILHRVPELQPRQPTFQHRLRMPRKLEFGEFRDAVAHPINDFLAVRSHLYNFFRAKTRHLFLKMGLIISDRYFPNALLRSEIESPRWTVTADISADIAAEAAIYEVPVLFVLLPGYYQLDQVSIGRYARAFGINPTMVDINQPSHLLTSEFETRGLIVIDTTDALRAAHLSGQNDLYGTIDTHFGPNGHRTVAAVLKPIILDTIRRLEKKHTP